ncbi:MAG: beta/gamma crystallin family protein [Opitutaceae bacterium]|nr:beta/gamma crystallin family protein [Opitutaceae bacterium]
MKTPLLSLVLGSLAFAAIAESGEDDRRREELGRRGGARIILYQHTDYRGESLTLFPGDELDNLASVSAEGGPAWNDRVSSIRIEGGASLLAYEHSRYRGHVLRLTENVRDLSNRFLPESVSVNWNDRISSLKVETRHGRPSRVKPDDIINRAYRDLLGREPDASGRTSFRNLIVDQGWSEEMVRDHLRKSDEFRREGADRIVRQAYLDVLGREPDPSGLQAYRRNLLERNWTGQDVRDALRNSPEYRNRPPAGTGN